MRVIRSQPAANFTQITNAVLRNHKLSHMARGVLAEMLSYPDGWSTTADEMWQRAARERPEHGRGEGRRAYRSAFAELEKAGHLERQVQRQEDGRFETVLILHDEPMTRAEADPGTTDVPLAVSRLRPAETGSLPRSDRRTANGRSVSGTSTTSTLRQATSERGSTELSLVASRRAHAASSASAEWPPSEEEQIAIVKRAAIIAGDNPDFFGDEEALDIWAHYIGDRRPRDPVAYLVKIIEDCTSIDGLLSNCPEREAS